MESSGTKGGGWIRSFPASVFSEGGAGGRATRAGGGGRRGRRGGGQHQQQQQPILLRDGVIDSSLSASSSLLAAGEEDLPGEDISLLDNRPVDQKMLRKRNQGHTQKMNLDESNVHPSQISLTANRFEANSDRQQLHLPKSRTEEEEEEEEEEDDDDDDDVTDHHQHSSLSSSSTSTSSSFNSFLFKPKPKTKPNVRENRIDESESESETADAGFQLPSRSDDAMTSPYDVRVVTTTKRDVITIVDETLTSDVIGSVGGDRTRRADVTAFRAKEPELGNLIDFD